MRHHHQGRSELDGVRPFRNCLTELNSHKSSDLVVAVTLPAWRSVSGREGQEAPCVPFIAP